MEIDLSKLKRNYQEKYPNAFFLEKEELKSIEDYLYNIKILQDGEKVEKVSKAGEGNMNLTLRVITNLKSLIVKQSRPWVEKYHTIAAPVERTTIEGKFYNLLSNHNHLNNRMPKIYHLDSLSNIMIIEDLGTLESFESLYSNGVLSEGDLTILAKWLAKLHALEFTTEKRKELVNRDMRILNHEHIFYLPLLPDNGINLDGITLGLKDAAKNLQNDSTYCQKVAGLGNLYLNDGSILLHGDYYPGSWVKKGNEIFIIDPEFGFFGVAEFDLGVTIAHIFLSNQKVELKNQFLEAYKNIKTFDETLVLNFAGVEIMRRLIGVAQLPISYGLSKKEELLELSKDWVLA